MIKLADFPKLTLVTGGLSSGKSLWAEGFVNASNKNKVYLATAEPFDDELDEKIKLHKSRRGKDWQLLEEPFTDGSVFSEIGEGDIILMECLSTWLGNLLYKKVNLEDHVCRFLENLAKSKADIVIVSVESGLGIIPTDPASRSFVRALGNLNQTIARDSELVILVTAGIPLVIKGNIPQ